MNLECVWKSRNDTGANSTSAHADRFLASYSCNNFTIALSKSTQNPCILPARRRCGALSFMVFRTKEGAQARGLLAARTKYSRSKAQHIRELCHKDTRNAVILGNYVIKSMETSRIKGGLGEIQRFFCPLEQKNFRTTRPFCTSKKYLGAQRLQRKPAFPSSTS